MTGSAYNFRVTAPERETFSRLYGRAQKSGNVIAADAARATFDVQWRGAVIPDGLAPVSMTVAVRRTGEDESLVSVVIDAEPEAALSCRRDFAGPLGSRMAEIKHGTWIPRGLKTPPAA